MFLHGIKHQGKMTLKMGAEGVGCNKWFVEKRTGFFKAPSKHVKPHDGWDTKKSH